MSDPPPKLSMPPKTKSGEHPVVQGFRKKLESLAELGEELTELEQELEQYLRDVRSTPPPPEK